MCDICFACNRFDDQRIGVTHLSLVQAVRTPLSLAFCWQLMVPGWRACSTCSESSGKRVAELDAALAALDKRYLTALDIIGEKEEELQELRNDLTHVKEVFQKQTSGLLAKLHALEKVQPSQTAPTAAPVSNAAGITSKPSS
jgi:hypothetical protein